MDLNNELTEDVRSRLVSFRKSKKIRQEDIAEKFGITQGAYSQYENGKNSFLSHPKQMILQNDFNLNIKWLFTGKGLMEFDKTEDEDKESVLNDPNIEYKVSRITIRNSEFEEMKRLVASQQRIIESQQRTIEHLTNQGNGMSGSA